MELQTLIGPTVFRQEISQARGRSLAEYDVVRIPVKLDADEQARYDAAGKLVRAFLLSRRSPGQPRYGWEDLWAESGKDPAARRAQNAFYRRKGIEDRASGKLSILEDLFRLHSGERVIVFAGSNLMQSIFHEDFYFPRC